METLKFPHLYRKRGGDRDVSARATHLKAALEIVFRATIERKIMSNKTTFKRIALAVVAALGFGVLASGPSSAAIDETLTVSASTGTVAVGETLTVTVTNTFISTTSNESSVVVVSNPSSAFTTIVSAQTSDSSNVAATTRRTSGSFVDVTAATGDSIVASATGAFTKATYTIQMRNATTAGTYNVVITSRDAVGVIKKSATVVVTVTAAANSTPDATKSTAFIVQGTGSALASATAIADSSVVLAKGTAAGAASGAVILIAQKNALGATTYGNSVTVGESITAYIASGPGNLSVAGVGTAARVVTAKVGETITVLNDGTSGVASIVLGSTSLGSTWKTKSVTFYGDAAKASIALKGTGVVSDDSSNRVNELRVTLKDSSDVLVTTANNLYLNSDNETIVAKGWISATVDADLGYASVDLSSFIDLNDSGTAKITLASYGPDSTTAQKAVGFISNELTMTVVGKAATFKLSLDKKNYKPGDIAKVTISVVDGLGKAIADTAIASMLTSVGVTANGNTTSSGDTITVASATHGQGKYTYDYTIPQASGNLVFKATGSTGLLAVGQVAAYETVVVTDPAEEAANSALDAAQEATDAAIAATDAAVLAQESADAAAVAAEAAAETAAEAAEAAKSAVDAVTKLSGEVTKLLTQLATLQKLMARIAKKVGVKV